MTLSSNGVKLNLIQSFPMLKDVLNLVKVEDQMQKINETTVLSKSDVPASKLERQIFPDSPEAENKLQKPLFKVDGEHDVLVTAYVKGPYEFYVRFVSEGTQKYKEFQQSLENVLLVPLEKEPVVGNNYLSVIEASTIDIFRVKIKEIQDKHATVQFIDEGLEKVVSFDTLYEMPVQTDKVPPYVYQFSLAKLNSASHLDDDELAFYFKRITVNRRLKLKIVSKNGE